MQHLKRSERRSDIWSKATEKSLKRASKGKKLILVLMAIGLLGVGSVMAASTDSADVNLLVTPVVTTDLNVNPTFYNFGAVNVNVSTCSTSALTLTNAGSVGITIDKAVWTDDSWDVTLATAVQDGFDLWAMVNSGASGQADFGTAISSFNESALQTFNALTEGSGTAVSMSPSDTDNLWFRLDMPQFVSDTDQKTIHVRLRANPN